MRLLINNVLSLVWFVAISVVEYVSTVLPFGNQTTQWYLVGLIPILIATPILFILTGRYALKTQGSSIKDLVSVLLVFIIGLLLTPGMAFSKHLNGNVLYFLYLTPLDLIIMHVINNWDPLMAGKGIIGLLSGGLFSFIPTQLMWIGLRWRVRKHP